MPRYLLLPLAQRDVDGIWNYSAERWGRDRANSYLESIKKALAMLAANPRRGRVFEPGLPNYFKYAIGNHMIFFRVIEEGIAVVRILHQNMDFERHLRETE